jgi:hypothetical protein
MKKVLAVVLMVFFIAGVAGAVAEMVTMKSKTGEVTFSHKFHGDSLGCKACHGEGKPGKLTLGKDSAHKLCKGCHETKKAGPTKCFDCHTKK